MENMIYSIKYDIACKNAKITMGVLTTYVNLSQLKKFASDTNTDK